MSGPCLVVIYPNYNWNSHHTDSCNYFGVSESPGEVVKLFRFLIYCAAYKIKAFSVLFVFGLFEQLVQREFIEGPKSFCHFIFIAQPMSLVFAFFCSFEQLVYG